MATINGRPRATGTLSGAVTSAAITDSSGGAVTTTLAAVSNAVAGGVGLSSPTAADVNAQLALIRDALASLADQHNKLRADLAAKVVA